jgi:hypothetical protein
MIEWKGTRKDGKVAVGKEKVGDTEIEWFVTKSAGGLSYSLHLGAVKTVPMVTRSTIIECKLYAEAYF